MKQLFLILCIFFLFTSFSVIGDYEEYDIVAFYTNVEADLGTKAIDSYGDIIEVESILVKNDDLKPGKYSATVTRKGDNMYQIDGSDIYIETSLCLELAIYEDVIIKIVKYKGYNFGTIYFEE